MKPSQEAETALARLIEKRKRRGISQAAIAKTMGTKAHYVNRLEIKRNDKLSVGALISYARALGYETGIMFRKIGENSDDE